jgi:hypothetical protein
MRWIVSGVVLLATLVSTAPEVAAQGVCPPGSVYQAPSASAAGYSPAQCVNPLTGGAFVLGGSLGAVIQGPTWVPDTRPREAAPAPTAAEPIAPVWGAAIYIGSPVAAVPGCQALWGPGFVSIALVCEPREWPR